MDAEHKDDVGLDEVTEDPVVELRFGDTAYTMSAKACAYHSTVLKTLIFESKHDPMAAKRSVPVPEAVVKLGREAFEYILEVIKRLPGRNPLPGPYVTPLPDASKPETCLGPTATGADKDEVRSLARLFDRNPEGTQLVYNIILDANALDMQGLLNAGAAVVAGRLKRVRVPDLNRALDPKLRFAYMAEQQSASEGKVASTQPAKKANTADE